MKIVTNRILVAFAMAALVAGCGSSGPSGGSGTTTSGPVVDKHKDFGDYTVHFNAITTDLLPADVARQYNIVRSKSRAMLNVVVLKDKDGAPGKAVTGKIVAQTTNLTGQLKNLTLRQITEGDAIYYIGDIPVAHGEVLIFDLNVTPTGATETFNVRFQQQFVTE